MNHKTWWLFAMATWFCCGCKPKDEEVKYPYRYFVSWTAPITNGSMEGYTVVQFTKPARTIDDINLAANIIKPSVTNLSGNVILKTFTPLQ